MNELSNIIDISHDVSYCPEAQAIFTTQIAADKFNPAIKPIEVSKGVLVAPWGEDNDLPQKVMEKVGSNDVVGSNLHFNAVSTYGFGIVPMIKNDDGTMSDCDIDEVNDFFDNNDINGYFLEQVNDMMAFFNVFPQIILSGDRKKIVGLYSLEASFSRWGSITQGESEITQHYYSAKWGSDKKPSIEDIDVSRVLSRYNTLEDLKTQIDGTTETRFVLQISMPTPGRTYYSSPNWHSLFKTGWYDLSCMIPKFKIALLKNNLAVRNIVYISDKYWEGIMKRDGISATDTEAIQKMRKTEYERIKTFISDESGKGGTLVTSKETYASSAGKAIEDKQIVIEPVKSEIGGGELIQDSEEASNVISYTMGVNTSLIGSTPGKSNGSLGGSDKETLFSMKQLMMRPYRDRLIKPLYLIKKFNNWDKRLVFVVPELKLDTKTTNNNQDVNK